MLFFMLQRNCSHYGIRKNSLESIHVYLKLCFIKIVEGDNNYNLIQQLKCKFHKWYLFVKNVNAKSDRHITYAFVKNYSTTSNRKQCKNIIFNPSLYVCNIHKKLIQKKMVILIC